MSEPADDPAGESNAEPATAPDTAVALSGGGHRAMLFTLGALLALADAGVNRRVSSISSVSGGSMGHAGVATRLTYNEKCADEVEDVVRELGRIVARPPLNLGRRLGGWAWGIVGVALLAVTVGPWLVHAHPLGLDSGWLERHLDLTRVIVVVVGTILVGVLARLLVTGGGPWFSWWGTWAHLSLVIALAELTYAGIPRLGVSLGVAIALYLAGSVLFLFVWWLRGRVAARAFAHTLFPSGASTELRDLPTSLNHVFCATDLHAGEHVYFAPNFVSAYRFGLGTPNDLPLHTPVQASAAFPSVFPVIWTSLRRFDMQPFERQKRNPAEFYRPRFLALVDGGVYDNMGDQWAQSQAEFQRAHDSKVTETKPQTLTTDALIVVNASRGRQYGSVCTLHAPIVGWLLALMREESVLYDGTTAQRRHGLIAQFDNAARGGPGLRGTLAQISTNPYKGCDHRVHRGDIWKERLKRADQASAWLKKDGWCTKKWDEVARDNAAIATTLVGFDIERCASLLHHGYVLTAVNAHIFLGHPLPKHVRPLSGFCSLLRS
jgi:predicted acylesterase/phospholipase RssA